MNPTSHAQHGSKNGATPPRFDLHDPDLPSGIENASFASGNYPYERQMKRKAYQADLVALQTELVKLQAHVRESGERIVILFEGRDAAGKGGTIKRFREHMNPRHARIVALAKPTETEQGQWYFQRYIAHLPTAGEIVLFDRSWYNRAVVEPVMGFCTPDQTERFLSEAPRFEKSLTEAGTKLFKIWLNIGREMQWKRFHDRRHDVLKAWKLSPVDVKALEKWDDYTKARDRMIAHTHTDHAEWTVIRANDKRRARLGAIRHVLNRLDYAGKDLDVVRMPDPRIVGTGHGFLGGEGE